MTLIHVVGAAIIQGDRCLVAERGPAMSLAGKWEFPGGKVEPGETAALALAREIAEELNLTIAVGRLLGTGQSSVGAKTIQLDVYAATITRGSLVLREHARVSWLTADALPDLDFAEADVPIVPRVVAWLREQKS